MFPTIMCKIMEVDNDIVCMVDIGFEVDFFAFNILKYIFSSSMLRILCWKFYVYYVESSFLSGFTKLKVRILILMDYFF